MKKGIVLLVAMMMLISYSNVYAQEEITTSNYESQNIQDDMSQYQYTVSDDENFVDGVMSNPDGYEGTGYEKDGDEVSTIFRSKARGSGYDLTWSTLNGKKVMYDGYGNVFGYGECKKVIDVSLYNGNIDWATVKNSGIDGAILRITSFAGGTMHEDDKFASNLAGCRNTKMPFGVYMYSYATNTTKAANEANYVVSLLKKYNVQPSELTYSVYYDLEGNSSTQGLSVSQNLANVNTFMNILSSNGYKANVYSYTSYLNENLNSPDIHKYASWVAQYGKSLTFKNNYYKGNYGWQYRSNGSVPGISGDVDVSCFSNFYGYDSENHVNEELGRGEDTPYLSYRANCQNVGWLAYFNEPNSAGTTGRGFPLYQLQITGNNMPLSAHLSAIIKTNSSTLNYDNIEKDTTIGKTNEPMRQVMFDLSNVEGYHLEYRVHSANIGWQDWVKQGEYAGNISKDIQAIDFRLVADESVTVEYPQIYYNAHLASIGWMEYVPDSQLAGKIETSKNLQAIHFGIYGDTTTLSGKVYVEDKGWQEFENADANTVIGTTGQAKALQSVQFNLGLYGYTLNYRVYQENGWSDWVEEGQQVGEVNKDIYGIEFKLMTNVDYINQIQLNQTSLKLNKDDTYQLVASIRPTNTTADKTITWNSSNKDIATVKDGLVTAKNPGQCIITATSADGKVKAECIVNVTIDIKDITLNKNSITLNKGKNETLEATISPDDTTEDKTVTWTTGNKNVATVDQNGKVTAVDAGTTTITATTSNGKTATCKVSVLSPITSLILNKKEIKIQMNNSETLQATINPSNTTDDKTLTWTSSNPKIATVDKNGKVTGLLEGNCTITVKTANGKTATCQVTVTEQIPNVNYYVHVQTIGDQKVVANGETAGTTEQSKRLEGIHISIDNLRYTGSIQYRTHVQGIGWQDWKKDGELSGTSGEAKRLEAIEIKLSGDVSKYYDVYYRVHAQSYGWMDWTKNGEAAGTAGYGYRLEAVQIVLVKKGEDVPKAEPENKTNEPYKQKNYLSYQTHLQTIGWQGYVNDGETSGTSGQAKRLEAIQIELINAAYGGSIQYRTHIQTYGWETDWKRNGAVSGTSGQAKRLEAIQIQLTGEMAEKYDIYYRVHAQTYGWLGWAKNGESAGTEGMAKRLEAIEIRIVNKNDDAPGSTDNAFYH